MLTDVQCRCFLLQSKVIPTYVERGSRRRVLVESDPALSKPHALGVDNQCEVVVRSVM
jgi:hypothetical protein